MLTRTPAAVLRRPELGGIQARGIADLTLLRLEEGDFPITDSVGRAMSASSRLLPVAVVLAGDYGEVGARTSRSKF